MNNTVNINVEELSKEVERLKKAKEQLADILNDIKGKTDDLKDYWVSNTSETIFTNIEDFYKGYQSCIDNLQSDIDFLNETIRLYKEYEKSANTVIDDSLE